MDAFFAWQSETKITLVHTPPFPNFKQCKKM
jgi:hypothetical protein